MTAQPDDKLDRYLPILWAVAGGGVGLTIRYTFGLPVLKQLLPYLMAGPAAYVLIRITKIMWAAQKQQRTIHDKAETFAGMVVLIFWVIGISVAPFQSWISYQLFGLLISIAVFALLIILLFAISRLMPD
jgi:hypothetical protein